MNIENFSNKDAALAALDKSFIAGEISGKKYEELCCQVHDLARLGFYKAKAKEAALAEAKAKEAALAEAKAKEAALAEAKAKEAALAEAKAKEATLAEAKEIGKIVGYDADAARRIRARRQKLDSSVFYQLAHFCAEKNASVDGDACVRKKAQEIAAQAAAKNSMKSLGRLHWEEAVAAEKAAKYRNFLNSKEVQEEIRKIQIKRKVRKHLAQLRKKMAAQKQ